MVRLRRHPWNFARVPWGKNIYVVNKERGGAQKLEAAIQCLQAGQRRSKSEHTCLNSPPTSPTSHVCFILVVKAGRRFTNHQGRGGHSGARKTTYRETTASGGGREREGQRGRDSSSGLSLSTALSTQKPKLAEMRRQQSYYNLVYLRSSRTSTEPVRAPVSARHWQKLISGRLLRA